MYNTQYIYTANNINKHNKKHFDYHFTHTQLLYTTYTTIQFKNITHNDTEHITNNFRDKMENDTMGK